MAGAMGRVVLDPACSAEAEVGEHTRLGCCWTSLAPSSFAFHRGQRCRNLRIRSWFSARARKTAREGACAPHSSRDFESESFEIFCFRNGGNDGMIRALAVSRYPAQNAVRVV